MPKPFSETTRVADLFAAQTKQAPADTVLLACRVPRALMARIDAAVPLLDVGTKANAIMALLNEGLAVLDAVRPKRVRAPRKPRPEKAAPVKAAKRSRPPRKR